MGGKWYRMARKQNWKSQTWRSVEHSEKWVWMEKGKEHKEQEKKKKMAEREERNNYNFEDNSLSYSSSSFFACACQKMGEQWERGSIDCSSESREMNNFQADHSLEKGRDKHFNSLFGSLLSVWFCYH